MSKVSKRADAITDSVTLALNAKATQLKAKGEKVYNFTAGQLPFKPPTDFIEAIRGESHFLKSFQYSPASGSKKLKQKTLDDFKSRRNLNSQSIENWDVLVSNGAKHSLSTIMGTIIDPGDKVMLLGPYWLSYPHMVKGWGGEIVEVLSEISDGFAPSIEKIGQVFESQKIKAIVVNSPNNPSGVCYSDSWMKELATLLKRFPETWILSDEIYSELYYYDPAPSQVYQFAPELLERTLCFDGISKSLASTGLRIGFTLGPKEVLSKAGKIQAHFSSGPNSMIQYALEEWDWSQKKDFLISINDHLRKNTQVLKEILYEHALGKLWYQTQGAFYFLLDFSKTAKYEALKTSDDEDLALRMTEELLLKERIAVVPTGDFGLKNAARLSMVVEEETLREGLPKLLQYLKS